MSLAKPHIPLHIIRQIEANTGLLFLEDQPANEVCYANAPELRDDFKTGFTLQDIISYFSGQKSDHADVDALLINNNLETLPLPTDAESFWRVVNKARRHQ